MDSKNRMKKLLIQATKISVGSCVAIYIAHLLDLQFATSAGSIALLTLVTTRWETMKLSLYRLLTFLLTVGIAGITFMHLDSAWLAYGIYIFLLVVICELMGWKATISVNAVIGTHFLSVKDFGVEFIINEFLLLFIGISIAIVLNLFRVNRSQKETIIRSISYTEEQLQMILKELASYLFHEVMQRDVWEDISDLEKKLEGFLGEAYEYQYNTFQSHPQYYIDYFEMRIQQCGVIHSLHSEMQKIRTMPEQAKIVADFILYMSGYVIETNSPTLQIEKLETLVEEMESQPLPSTRDEFVNRALLYHILMDIEEFIMFKKRFVDGLDDKQRERYWFQKDHEGLWEAKE